MILRPFRAADTEALAALWLDASRAVHGFLGDAELRRQQGLLADHYLREAETWVAEGETAGEYLGFIGLIDDFVGGLFVAPAAQGCGVGRALVDHALARKGRLALEVYAANTAARAFYARLGFVETGRRPTDDLGKPFALIRLERAGERLSAGG